MKITYAPVMMVNLVNFGVKHRIARQVSRLLPSEWEDAGLTQDENKNRTLSFFYDNKACTIALGRYNVAMRMKIIAREWRRYERDIMARSAGLFIAEKLCERSFADQIMTLPPSPARTLRDRDTERRLAAAKNQRRKLDAEMARLQNKTKLHHDRLVARWATEGIPWEYIPPPKPDATFLDYFKDRK